MPSKYDKVLPGIPKAPVADQSYQDKVDAEKIKINTALDPATGEKFFKPKSATELAELYGDLCAEDTIIKAKQYDVNLRFAAVEQLLAASQDAKEPEWGRYGASDNMVRLEDGSKLQVQVEPYGQVKDKEAFRRWCIANGYERQLQLWPSVMNSLCKERLLEAAPIPDGCEVFQKNKIVFTPAKGK